MCRGTIHVGQRTPAKRPHREVVRAAVEDSKLFCKVIQRVEAVAGVKTFLVLPVAAFHLAVVARGVEADEHMAYTKFSDGGLKPSGQISLAVEESVGKFKTIVCQDALHPDAPTGTPLEQLSQKIGRGIGALFRVGGEETQAGELVNGCVLEQAELWACNTFAGYSLCPTCIVPLQDIFKKPLDQRG